VMCLTAIIYTYIRKKNVSRHILRLMFFPAVVTLLCYISGRLGTVEFVPAGYVFAQIMYLLIIRRMLLYDITESGVDSLVNMNTTGFISFDRKMRYIGCNETAAEMFPFLSGLAVDRSVDKVPVMKETVLKWIEDFRADEANNSVTYPYGEKIYLVSINNLCFRGRKKGYQLFITDNTVDQKYIALLDGFNSELKEEVEKKTAGLEYMQSRVILGMAVMVESRDNSTGGHIRRTSDVMKVLTDEIMKDNTLGLSEQLCEKLVKAAPMHDLGKIAVDDAILRKPGRFTPEEFEKMKTHAPEGARIIHTILEGTDDREFARIAEVVAHYHHERWDGSGYPDGLKGEQIPIEARIMAIADVYDALVSKRVYKESMSFEKADAIIMESMGKHFDKRLEKYYVRARPRLEEYYSKAE
ncbi:MAG: HD-GYP domain-containing protein, partial [Ruminiclostridium sp.]|nr:HD-GYP domain-containing protein [Ruminiclostridium sp.]